MKWLTNPEKGIEPRSCGGHVCWDYKSPDDCVWDSCVGRLCIKKFCFQNY